MADTKKEHYVPRCYLENCATDGKRINVFDKWKLAVRNNQDIMNVAMENAFYDVDLVKLLDNLECDKYNKIRKDLMTIVDTDKWENVESIIGNKKYIEKEHFGKIEGAYSQVLQSVIKKSYNGNRWVVKNSKAMSEHEKVLLSFFIATQVIRTKRFRETLGDMFEGTANALLRKIQRFDGTVNCEDDFHIKANPDYIKMQHSLMILEPEVVLHLAEIMEKHVWVMCVNKTTLPFYTSDTPIVKIPHNREGTVSCSGYASPGIEVAFPVTHNLLLCMFDANEYGMIFKDRQFYEMTDLEEVKYYNCCQLIQSYRCVFAKEHDFAMAMDYCQKHPELAMYQSEIEVF